MTRQTRRASWIGGLGIFALASTLGACGGSPEDEALGTSESALTATGAPHAMIAYSPRARVDESTLLPMGPAESLGGRVLAGAPNLYARIDYNEGGMMAGIFKATTGRVRIDFPFSEHATILDGEVTITDETGQTRTYRKGDSYFVRQGQVVIWDVKGRHVIKSFFNVTK